MASASPISLPGEIARVRFTGVSSINTRRAEGRMGVDYRAAFEVTLQSGTTLHKDLSIPDFELDRAGARSLIQTDAGTGQLVGDAVALERLFLRKFNSTNISHAELSVGQKDFDSIPRE